MVDAKTFGEVEKTEKTKLLAIGGEQQLGKFQGAELKIAEPNLALSGQNLANIRGLLQTVAKMAMVDFLRNIMNTKHQNKFQNPSSHETGFKSTHFGIHLADVLGLPNGHIGNFHQRF